MAENLIHLTERGLYCPAGDFYIDPWYPVPRAVITHAHGDHCVAGCQHYLVAAEAEPVYRTRLTGLAEIRAVAYGEDFMLGDMRVSLHPAGHILGSAQVRLEHRGQVWVVSGDYKLTGDPTCTPFEPVRCHTFVTESTFALPIYRWPDAASVFEDINAWWKANQEAGRATILFGYALGKAQRLLAGVDASIGPIYTHGGVERFNMDYRNSGVKLPETTWVGAAGKVDWSRALIVAPPMAVNSPWMRKFGAASTGFASGWMRIRGTRRRRAMDRGFVISDHADWPGLGETIKATGAERVWVTHGYVGVMVRWLQERGFDAQGIPTRFKGEEIEIEEGEAEEPPIA